MNEILSPSPISLTRRRFVRAPLAGEWSSTAKMAAREAAVAGNTAPPFVEQRVTRWG